MGVLSEIGKDLKNIFHVQDKKAFIKGSIPYLAFFYIGDIFACHVNGYVGGDLIDRIMQALMEIDSMEKTFSFDGRDMLGGIILAGIVKAIIYSKSKNAKKFRKGMEYGSARWVA